LLEVDSPVRVLLVLASAARAMDLEKMKRVHWVPLESNPDMLTDFAQKVGLPDGFEFVDVFGTDPELLAMVPPTRLAVTLLFQSSDKIREAKEAQRLAIEKDGQKVSDKLVYLKQYVGNACGTIACLHSMANNAEALGLSAESPVGKFLDTIKGKSPQDAGLALVDATDLHSASEAGARGGQTSAPQATGPIAFAATRLTSKPFGDASLAFYGLYEIGLAASVTATYPSAGVQGVLNAVQVQLVVLAAYVFTAWKDQQNDST